MPPSKRPVRRKARKPQKEQSLAAKRSELVERFFLEMPRVMGRIDDLKGERHSNLLKFFINGGVSFRWIEFLKNNRERVLDRHSQESTGTEPLNAVTRGDEAAYLRQMRLFLRLAREAERKKMF